MQSVTYRFSESNRSLDIVALLCFALALYPLLMTVGTGLLLLDAPGTDWIKSYGVAEDVANFWAHLAMAVTMGLLFAFILRWKSPFLNFLTLDDVGLTYVIMGRRRTWPWREIESAAVAIRWPGLQAGKLTIAGQFGWGARIGLLFMNGLASATRVTITLPDFYEPPIEDVVAGINGHRDSALGIKRPPREEAQPSPPMQAVAAGQSITFSMSKAAFRYQRILAFAPLIVIAVALILFRMDGDLWSELWSTSEELAWLYLAIPVLLLFTVFMTYRSLRPESNSLRLDATGITYRRQGRRYAWPWKDVSVFEHRKLAGSNMAGRRQVITFSAPGRDWTWRWVRRLYGLPAAPPTVVIDGLYDTPVEEIAATLNAYRERALGGGDTSA